MLVTHILGGAFNPHMIVICKAVSDLSGSKIVTVSAGMTFDGLYYCGHGQTVREAVMSLAAKIDNGEPRLYPGDRQIPIQLQTPEQTAEALDLWERLRLDNNEFFTRETGLIERLAAVSAKGFVMTRNTYGAGVVVPEPSLKPAPVEPPAPDVCGACGGDPAVCGGAVRVGLADYQCKNTAPRFPVSWA